jgi:hypothetical protein
MIEGNVFGKVKLVIELGFAGIITCAGFSVTTCNKDT